MSAARDNERRFYHACTQEAAELPPVLALYRRLVHGNVSSVLRGVLPRTAGALAHRLEAEVDAFLRERGPATPHVRDVPFELVALRSHGWDAWTCELSRLELAEFRIGYAERSAPTVAGPLAMEAPIALCGPLALERFAWSVQASEPTADPHALLFYRDADEQVRTLRLSAMAQVLLREALAGQTLQHALVTAAAEAGLVLDPPTLTSTARFLDDLSERGVVLGAAG